MRVLTCKAVNTEQKAPSPFPPPLSTPFIPHRPSGPAQGPITVKVAPRKQAAAMLRHNT